MGTLDHAIALQKQLEDSGNLVNYVVLKNSEKFPNWAGIHFPKNKRVEEEEALDSIDAFDAIWFSEPYEELRPAHWRSERFKSKVIYSGYGVPMTNWTRGNFELDFFKNCSFIFSASEEIADLYKYSSSVSVNSLWTGDPLLYEIRAMDPEINAQKKFLWASHWTEKWVDGTRGFSRWEQTVTPLYQFFSENPDNDLIIRLHPHARFDKNSQPYKVFQSLRDLPNVSESSSSMLDDIRATDAMITDGVTIIAYFGATGKPIGLITDPSSNPPFNDVGSKIANATSKLATSEAINLWLTKVNINYEQLTFESRGPKELVNKYFPTHMESPGMIFSGHFIGE